MREYTKMGLAWVGIQSLYWVFVWIPSTLYTLITLPTFDYDRAERMDMVGLNIFAWSLCIVPLVYHFTKIIIRRRRLKRIVETMSNDEFKAIDVVTEGQQVYLGIDWMHGTILYVNMRRKGQYEIVGLDLNDWRRYGYEGKKIRIETRMVGYPYLEISAPGGEGAARRIFDVMDAMETRAFDKKTNFAAHVKAKCEETTLPGIQMKAYA